MSKIKQAPPTDYYVVSFSGGKDSTAMLLHLLELGEPIDEIIFCDTGMEFPEMYEHIKKVEEYIGRKITILKSKYTFEYLLLEYRRTKGRYMDAIGLGWPRLMYHRWCTTTLKTRVLQDFYKFVGDKNIVEYVGIAADEQNRIKKKKYPLVEWGWTEADCLAYCKERGFDWGGLYDIFSRVSCWCCPFQSLKELRLLYEHFPNLWGRLKTLEHGTILGSGTSFKDNEQTVERLQARFELEKEWLEQGKNIRSKAFYTTLKDLYETIPPPADIWKVQGTKYKKEKIKK